MSTRLPGAGAGRSLLVVVMTSPRLPLAPEV
jgi:hypothetical protein